MTKKKSFTFRGLLLLLIPMIAFAVFGFYHRKDAIVRRIVQQELEKRFPEWNIRLDSARLVESKGVRLRDLKLSVSTPLGDDCPIFSVDEVTVMAPISFASLFHQDVRPERVTLTRPVFHVNDETIDTFRHFLHREDKDSAAFLCPLEINEGCVVLKKRLTATGPPTEFLCQGMDAILLPPGFSADAAETWRKRIAAVAEVCSLASDETKSTVADRPEVPNPPDSIWRLEGVCQNPFLKRLHFFGMATPDMGDWSLAGTVDSLEIEPRLLTRFIVDPTLADSLETFQGRTSLSFSLRKDDQAPAGVRCQCDGEVFRGSLVTPFLDHPISDLFVHYRLSENQLEVERLTARSGPVLILAQYLQNGFGVDRTFTFKTQMEEFPLNQTFFKKWGGLPSSLCEKMKEVSFSTVAKINLEMEGDGKSIRPKKVALQCRDLTVSHDSLPLQVDPLEGKLTLDETGRLTFDFFSAKERGQIRVHGDYHDFLTTVAGTTRFEAVGISIDDRLLDSLPKNCRDEIKTLHPTGTLNAAVTLCQAVEPASDKKVTTEPHRQSAGPDVEIVLDVCDGTIRYDRFPFPISQIGGTIRYSNEVWTFTDFHGSGATATLSASGRLVHLVGDHGRELALSLRLDRFPLGDEFCAALTSPFQKELVEKLHLRGQADADVQLRYLTETQNFDLKFEARPIASETSIQPDHFPYELSGLDGVIVYQDGKITINDLRGKNGPMTFTATVDCQFSPDGSCSVNVAPFTVDELLIDRRLQNAVPSRFLSFLDQINLAGYFNASGAMEFHRPSADAPTEVVWDTDVILHQNSAEFGKEISGICGKADLCGFADGKDSFSFHGELDLDSLCVGNVQVTRLTGPFYFDGQQFLFGKTVPPLTALPFYHHEFFKNRYLSSVLSHSADEEILSQREPNGSRRPQTVELIPSDPSHRETPVVRSQSPERIPTSNAPARVASLTPQPFTPATSALGGDLSVPSWSAENIAVAKKKRPAISHTEVRPLTGEIFHGQGSLSGTIRLDNPVTYQLGFNFQEGRLDELIRDMSAQSQRLGGKVSAFVNLQGEGRNVGTLTGNGGLAVKDAELYEIPIMMKILRSLSVKEPDRLAFNSSFIDFTVFGNRLRLDRVLMEGDTLTLFGDGWLTVEGSDPKIDLTMNSRFGNVQSQIPVVSDVLGGAGDQIARIRIEGPLSEASIRQERFPGIKKAMWTIFPDRKKESGKK